MSNIWLLAAFLALCHIGKQGKLRELLRGTGEVPLYITTIFLHMGYLRAGPAEDPYYPYMHFCGVGEDCRRLVGASGTRVALRIKQTINYTCIAKTKEQIVHRDVHSPRNKGF